jgi:hypothetical protein
MDLLRRTRPSPWRGARQQPGRSVCTPQRHFCLNKKPRLEMKLALQAQHCWLKFAFHDPSASADARLISWPAVSAG